MSYLHGVADAYADLVFEPEPFTQESVVRRFLDLSPGVVSALRAAGASFVMMPAQRGLSSSMRLDERAPLELARAEALAHDWAAWPIYVGTGSFSRTMKSLGNVKKYLGGPGGRKFRGPPLGASPARGALAGYVLIGDGGAIFYTANGLLAGTGEAQGLVLELLGRRPAPGPSGR